MNMCHQLEVGFGECGLLSSWVTVLGSEDWGSPPTLRAATTVPNIMQHMHCINFFYHTCTQEVLVGIPWYSSELTWGSPPTRVSHSPLHTLIGTPDPYHTVGGNFGCTLAQDYSAVA